MHAHHATYGLPAVITPCVNNYGPYQHPEKAIPLFAICALVGHPLPVYGSGRNTREWIHVDDHAAALFAVLRKRGIEGETFNIGTGEERSTLAIARGVLEALPAMPASIERVADRPGHVRRHAVDSSKIRRLVGWRPARSLAKDLPRTVRWYADHPDWWRPTVVGPGLTYFDERYPGLVRAVETAEG